MSLLDNIDLKTSKEDELYLHLHKQKPHNHFHSYYLTKQGRTAMQTGCVRGEIAGYNYTLFLID